MSDVSDMSDLQDVMSDKENISDEEDKEISINEQAETSDLEDDHPVEMQEENDDVSEENKKMVTKPASEKASNKKVGPQKQKKAIHTLLKKAKIYEIRKLTRRIETLRKLKGTDEQKAKNNRKCDKFVKEIEAMKGFIIATLTDRTVSVFKGTAEQNYLDIWTAASDQKTFEEMLQKLSSTPDSDEKYDSIAYLRMLSSKDVLQKLKLVTQGVSINPKKDKQRSKKSNLKQLKNAKQKQKHFKKEDESTSDNPSDVTTDPSDVTTDAEKPDISIPKKKALAQKRKVPKINNKSQNEENKANTSESAKIVKKADVKVSTQSKSKDGNVENNVVQAKKGRKLKTKVDDFFLDHTVTVSESDNSDSEADEFSAPVDQSKQNELVKTLKRNRMGQRQRKQILERKQQEKEGKFSNTRNFRNQQGYKPRKFDHSNGRHPKSSFKSKPSIKTNDVKKPKEVDKTLHPSWQAKQKQKQNVVAFTGTKITFDD